MKTIQQVIRELDPKEIEETYFSDYGTRLEKLENVDDLTIGEYKAIRSLRFQEFLKRIKEMSPVESEDGKHGILFRTKVIGDNTLGSESTELIHMEELMTAEDLSEITTYAYEFTPQNEAITFLVADNKLTQDQLVDVASDFLYEISFFGYEQEDQAEEIGHLNEAIKEVEEHPERLVQCDTDELWKDLNLPERYPNEEELRGRYYEAERKYCKYCRSMELEEMQKKLKEG